MQNASTIDADLALRFSIFMTPEAHQDWEKYIRYAREQTRFPRGMTFQWIDALAFLREQLNDDFIRRTNHYHPLIDLITGGDVWQVERLIQYAGILKGLLKNDPDYPAFLEKLKAPVFAKKEGLDFLLIGRIMQDAGLQARFPKEILNQKNPDIVCTDLTTGQSISIEVSRTDPSDRRIKQGISYDQLSGLIHRHLQNPFYSANQRHIPPFVYHWKLATILSELQKKVAVSNTWTEHEDDYISIRLYPLSEPEAFYAWLQKEDRRKGFHGIPLDCDDTTRISGYKIADEADQIPPGQPGIIIIPVDLLHFWQQHAGEGRRSIQRRLQDRPNIIGVYLYAELLNPDAAALRFPTDDRFARQQIRGSLTRYSLFIRNPAFDCPIHPSTLQRILSILE